MATLTFNNVEVEEAMREVEIRPFTLSDDTEAIILANSGIVMGEWKAIKAQRWRILAMLRC